MTSLSLLSPTNNAKLLKVFYCDDLLRPGPWTDQKRKGVLTKLAVCMSFFFSALTVVIVL